MWMQIKKTDNFEFNKDEIIKRKPKPFRYVKDEYFLTKDEINFDKNDNLTVMKRRERNFIVDIKNPSILCNDENLGKIDEIIKKHKEINKNY